MRVCPTTAQIKSTVAPHFDELIGLVVNFQAKDPGENPADSVDGLENSIYEVGMALLRELFRQALLTLEPEESHVEQEGTNLKRVTASKLHVLSRFGSLTVPHWLYRGPGRNSPTVSMVAYRAGLVNGFLTGGAGQLISFFQAENTIQGCIQACEVMGLSVSPATIHKLMAQVNTKWEDAGPENEAELRSQFQVPRGTKTLAISIDGVMAPMRLESTEGGSAGRAYRELGCGTIAFYDNAYDRKRLGTIYHARKPQEYKVDLTQLLGDGALHILRQAPGLRRVYLGDGAPSNWNSVRNIEESLKDQVIGLEPECFEILDWFHASGHLQDACDAVHGQGTPKCQAYFEKLKKRLLEEEESIVSVIHSLRWHRGQAVDKTTLNREIGYFEKHVDRMDYAYFSRLNLPIGSGVVEAACKTLVSQRLKRSGMRWSHSGAQAILSVRSWRQSLRFVTAWAIVRRELAYASPYRPGTAASTYQDDHVLNAA